MEAEKQTLTTLSEELRRVLLADAQAGVFGCRAALGGDDEALQTWLQSRETEKQK